MTNLFLIIFLTSEDFFCQIRFLYIRSLTVDVVIAKQTNHYLIFCHL
jgi:hypothetical protein